MNFKKLLFIDTETTGLDPLKHEIIEAAWILTDPSGVNILERFSAKLNPEHIETAEPKALEVNKYSAERWAAEGTASRSDVAERFAKVSANAVLVAHNVSFDENFFRAMLLKEGQIPAWGYHKVDTVALSWPLFANSKLTGLSLGTVCEYLGIVNPAAHTAAADVSACREVYLALMKKYLR